MVSISGRSLVGIIPVLILVSCASGPQSSAPPLWVGDPAKAYPDSEWLCVVEQERDAKAAESAAVVRLAQVFRVDLNAVSVANRQFAQSVGRVKGKLVAVSSESREMAQELESASAVSGLIGLQVESWDGGNGRAYANARMNRKECSARYAAMIRENEKVIGQLIADAADRPQTFEAFQMLNLAYSFALAADNFHDLLTVLDPSAISRRPSYGNAGAVRALAQEAGRAIVVTVSVEGDSGGRIAKAFSEALNSRGFRTNAAGANPYTLAAGFSMEDVTMSGSANKFVRYALAGSLMDTSGVELLSFSENGREGHLTEAEARQRAVRAAERSIGSAGFAENFDALLASLL